MAAPFSTPEGNSGVIFRASPRFHPKTDADGAHLPACDDQGTSQKWGKASIRNIAAAFLSRDESQLEYYEQITKDMPGKVLGKHGVVERDGDEYRLTIDPSSLSSEERDELVRLCDEAISAYLQKRGTAVFDHRRAALGYLSGSLRYEVLKRAGFRCELCGISADERAIEVDHIIPRKHGGEDDLTNLQALREAA